MHPTLQAIAILLGRRWGCKFVIRIFLVVIFIEGVSDHGLLTISEALLAFASVSFLGFNAAMTGKLGSVNGR